MSALTTTRSTQRFGFNAVEPAFNFPIKASTKCIQGGIAVIDAGYVAPGRTALGLIAVGVFDATPPAGIDNTSGAAGALTAPVRRGIFKFANSAAGDAIAQADVGGYAYIVDDQTVAKTDGPYTRSIAGVIMQVDSDGVWVEIGADFQNPFANSRSVVTMTIAALSTVATNDVLARFTPGFAGRILGVSFYVTTAVTTGSKLATLTPSVAGTPTTGGAVALTSANCTPKGASVAGSAITAGGSFTSAQEITLVATAVTAFAEGAGVFVMSLG